MQMPEAGARPADLDGAARAVALTLNGFSTSENDRLRRIAQAALARHGASIDDSSTNPWAPGIHVLHEQFAREIARTWQERHAQPPRCAVYVVLGAGDDPLTALSGFTAFLLSPLPTDAELELGFVAAFNLLRAQDRMEADFVDRARSLVLANDEWQALLVSNANLEDQLQRQNALFTAMFDTVVDGVITIDERARIELINPAARQIFGYSTEEVVGRNVSMLMLPRDAAVHDGYVASYIATGQGKIIGVGGREVVCRRKDGSTFDAELSVAEARVGETRRFTGIVRDISQRKAMQRELAESQARLARQNAALVSLGTRKDTGKETLRDSLTVICGVCRVALDIDTVRVWLLDQQEARLYVAAGWPDYAAEPRLLSAARFGCLFEQLEVEGVVMSDGQADVGPCALLLDAEGLGGKASLFAAIRSKSGIAGVLQCAADSARSWMLDERNFIGFLADQVALSVEQDQTLRAKKQVRDREQRLANAQRIANLGDWQWYPASDEFTGSDELFHLLGCEPPTGTWTLADFLAFLHPNDRARAVLEIERCAENNTPLQGDFSIVRADGSIRYVHGQVVSGAEDTLTQRRVMGTVLDITERKVAEQAVIDMRDTLQDKVDEQTKDLIEARDEALAAERMMSAFLANMSHEIRTPLHAILSYAKFGHKKTDDPTQQEINGFFDEIRDSGEDLLALLNDLLDLSKLKAGKMDYEPVAVNVKELADKVVAQFGPAAQEKKINLMVVGIAPKLTIQADKNKLAQVLRNLVSNAIKFSPEGEMVRITAKPRDDGKMVIAVTDQGPGIPQDELQGIFDPFVQSSKTQNKAGGTGLGLAICKEIVENGHAGRIYAENNAGGGASFYVVLRASA